jgi:hypothetical protein
MAREQVGVVIGEEAGTAVVAPWTGTPPGDYAAFVLDPDGNNIEAVFHGEADRSAASVRIRF